MRITSKADSRSSLRRGFPRRARRFPAELVGPVIRMRTSPCSLSRPPGSRRIHCIGVTTTKSSIMRCFPPGRRPRARWTPSSRASTFRSMRRAEAYRAAVAFLKADPQSLGALVTTHKIDLYRACRDLFDVVDPLAVLMAGDELPVEASMASSICHAKDPISSGLAIDGFLPERHFEQTAGSAFQWALAARPSR